MYVPLRSGYGFGANCALARTIGLMLQKAVPHMVTLERRIKLRAVYVDYLQNAPSKTLVGVYSPRPTPAATVSTPVT